MPVTNAGIIAAAAIPAVSNIAASVFGGGSNAPTYYDQLRMQADRQRIVQEQYSKDFRTYAKNMGVSPYALLGMQMPSGPAGAAIQSDTDSRLSRAMSKMGQDVGRGIQQYMALRDLTSQERLRDAQANYYNTLSANVLNDSQKPKAAASSVQVAPAQVTASPKPSSGGVTAGGVSAHTFIRRADGLVTIKNSQEIAEMLEEQGVIQNVRDVLMDSSFEVTMANSPRLRGVIRAQAESVMRNSGKLAANESLIWSPVHLAFRVIKDSERIRRTQTKYERYQRLKDWQQKSRLPAYMTR